MHGSVNKNCSQQITGGEDVWTEGPTKNLDVELLLKIRCPLNILALMGLDFSNDYLYISNKLITIL